MNRHQIKKHIKKWLPERLDDNEKHYFYEQYLKHAAMSSKYALGLSIFIMYLEWTINNNNSLLIALYGLALFNLQAGRYIFARRAISSELKTDKHLFYGIETLSCVNWVLFLFLFGSNEQEQSLVFWRCIFIFIIYVFYMDTMKYSKAGLVLFPTVICIGSCIYIDIATLIDPVLKTQFITISILSSLVLISYGKTSYGMSRDIYSLIKQNKQLVNEMEELLIHDELTKQHNRRHFDTQLTHFIARFKRKEQSFCLAIVDIDYFKIVNDTYGHPAGDQLLIEFSRHIKNGLRASDVFARYGGEEFVILLPMTDIEPSVNLLNKIRQSIENSVFTFNGLEIKVTMSVGATHVKDNDSEQTILSRADNALYHAKENGRNQVIHF